MDITSNNRVQHLRNMIMGLVEFSLPQVHDPVAALHAADAREERGRLNTARGRADVLSAARHRGDRRPDRGALLHPPPRYDPKLQRTFHRRRISKMVDLKGEMKCFVQEFEFVPGDIDTFLILWPPVSEARSEKREEKGKCPDYRLLQ